MSHVDDGRLNALLDGELSPAEEREVEQHLAGCAACRTRLDEARRFLAEAADLLGAIVPPAARPAAVTPTPVPVVNAPPAAAGPRRASQTLKERAIDIDGATHQSPAIRLPEPPAAAPRRDVAFPPPRRRVPWRSLAWAASIVLTFSLGYLANDGGRTARTDIAAERDQLSRIGGETAAAPAVPATTQVPRQRAPTPADRPAGSLSGAGAERRGTGGTSAVRPAPRQAKADPAADRQPVLAAAPDPAADTQRYAAPPAEQQRPGISPAAPSRAAEAAADMAAGARTEEPPPTAAAQRRAAAPAAAPAPAEPRFRRANLDTAVVHLSGSVRLIDGMEPQRVEIGPGSLVPGADPSLDVIRVIYIDQRGRRITLDQQRLATFTDAANGPVAMLYGDTLTSTVGATTRIRWLDNKNFWMSLSGGMPAESLRVLADRVR